MSGDDREAEAAGILELCPRSGDTYSKHGDLGFGEPHGRRFRTLLNREPRPYAIQEEWKPRRKGRPYRIRVSINLRGSAKLVRGLHARITGVSPAHHGALPARPHEGNEEGTSKASGYDELNCR